MNAWTYLRQTQPVLFVLVASTIGSFLAVALNVFAPGSGISTLNDAIWTGVFFGLMCGAMQIGPRSREELNLGQRWFVRLLGFTLYFLPALVGGGLGLTVFK